MKFLRWLLVLGWSLAFGTLARGDWPHLRGPNYDGVSTETGLADAWPSNGPPQLWLRELGQGHSGFIVAEGKLFTQRQTLGGQEVICLDMDTGKTVWESRYDWSWQPNGVYPGPYGTPTWYRGKIYYTSPTGLVGCMDAKTGAILWSLNVREKFKGKGYGFGYAITPLVEEDRVILPVGGPTASLVALHVDDGRTLWTAGSDPSSYCSAMPITFEGRRCIVGFLENALVVVEGATGKMLCRQVFSSGYSEHAAWPLYQEPHLLLAGPFFAPAKCLQLKAGPEDLLQATTHWTRKDFCNDVVSSVLCQEHVFGFDLKQLQSSPDRPSRGFFKCLQWSTGKVCWSTDEVGHAAVLAADGKLLLLTDEGQLVLARADPTAYRELGRVQVFEGKNCWTPPTLWQGRLFLRSPSHATCLYVGRPENLPKEITTAPIERSGQIWRLHAAWLASRERDYPNDAPSWEEMATWFAACVLIVFGGAVLATAFVFLLTTTLLVGRRPSGLLLFLAFAFVLGLLGPNLFSTLTDCFLFTWPASLYAAFHATVWTCSWAEQQPSTRRARWLARLSMLGLVLVGYGYYEMCKAIGMYIGWSFLIGFVPAFPFTLLAAHATTKRRGLLKTTVWTLLAFSAYFWSVQALFVATSGFGQQF